MNKDITPKVSIIVPIYNTAPYLRRCLNSVANQTMRNIEIICVNDASTDDSPSILCEYANKDNRITLINFSRNQGVSAARNAAISIARGKYLGFVDSDDIVDLHFFESLYLKAIETNSYIVKASMQWIELDNTVRKINTLDIEKDRLEFKDLFWTAIFQTSFIKDNGISFPLDVINGEDKAFLVKAVSLASKVSVVDNVNYYYLRRPNSAYNENFTIKKLQSVIIALENIISFLSLHLHKIDENDYAKLAARHIMLCCWISIQTDYKDREKAIVDCANAAIHLYKMCSFRNIIDQYLITEHHILGKLIAAGDTTPIVCFFTGKITRAQIMISELRSRITARH